LVLKSSLVSEKNIQARLEKMITMMTAAEAQQQLDIHWRYLLCYRYDCLHQTLGCCSHAAALAPPQAHATPVGGSGGGRAHLRRMIAGQRSVEQQGAGWSVECFSAHHKRKWWSGHRCY
jgi:hypothetical protein